MANPWQGKRVLIAGLGATGLSMLHFFVAQEAQTAGYDATLTDEKRSELAQTFPNTTFYTGNLKDALHYDDCEIVAISPGISAYLPELKAFQAKGGKVTGDIDILSTLIHGRRDQIIAITGSNGKSTVTELTGFLCRSCGLDTVVAGNIGLPVLDAYQQRQGKSADVWVLELSSFQLETATNLTTEATTCLNISEDHLDRYNNLLHYAHTKANIFHDTNVQVLNADDPLCRIMAHTNQKIRWFSLETPCDYWLDKKEATLKAQNQSLIKLSELSLQGLHNASNVLASLALCEGIGLEREKLLLALPNFRGLPHRMEKVGEINGVVFIDDSKGTNIGATCAGLLGATSPVLLIAGGLGKGQDFMPLAQSAKQSVKHAFLIGQDAQAIATAFATQNITFTHCQTLPEAVNQAFAVANSGDWILLSPACASMDMFKNYAHRSEVFIDSFNQLKNHKG